MTEHRNVPDIVVLAIVDALAVEGRVSELLDIVRSGNVSDGIKEHARESLPGAIEVAGELKIRALKEDKKDEVIGILTRSLLKKNNPLQGDGVMSKGTVEKPASAGKDVKGKAGKLPNKS